MVVGVVVGRRRRNVAAVAAVLSEGRALMHHT